MTALGWSQPRSTSLWGDPILPLYAASLLIQLSLIGAVASTVTEPLWMPLWLGVAILGHAVSWGLRRISVPPYLVYIAVSIGALVWFGAAVLGSGAVIGISAPLVEMPFDFGLLIIIGSLASLRCFSLMTADTLLFSVVPALAILGLAGSNNPNIEIPIFFILILFAAIFSILYGEHLRRWEKQSRPRLPLVLHVAVSWGIVLLVFGGGAIFAAVSHPILSRFSPFGMSALSQIRRTFTNVVNQPTTSIPIGTGPISLSPTPVYEIHASEGGLYLTGVAETYTGRGWNRIPQVEVLQNEGTYPDRLPGAGTEARELHRFTLGESADRTISVTPRIIRQQIVFVERSSTVIPALSRPRRVGAISRRLRWNPDSGVLRTARLSRPGEAVEVYSDVAEPTPAALRQTPDIDRNQFPYPATLLVPAEIERVADLTRGLTAGLTNNFDRVQAIIRHIETTCPYTLEEVPTPRGHDAVDYYLFDSQRGACDLAGSAGALMCRTIGIPARIAVGYLVDEPLPSGDGYLVRQKDAHLWTQVYFEGYGWISFNPSPPLGSVEELQPNALVSFLTRYFARFRSGRIDSLLLGTLLVVTALILLRAGGSSLFQRWQSRRWEMALIKAGGPRALALLYSQAMRALEQSERPREGRTPRELMDFLRQTWGEKHPALLPLETLTEIYSRSNYAEDVAPEDVARAQTALRDLRDLLPRPPRRRTWLRRTEPAPEAPA